MFPALLASLVNYWHECISHAILFRPDDRVYTKRQQLQVQQRIYHFSIPLRLYRYGCEGCGTQTAKSKHSNARLQRTARSIRNICDTFDRCNILIACDSATPAEMAEDSCRHGPNCRAPLNKQQNMQESTKHTNLTRCAPALFKCTLFLL